MNKKFRKRLEKIEAILHKVETDMYFIRAARVQIEFAQDEIRSITTPLHNFAKKIDFDREILRLSNWLTDLESKVSMKFYQNVGIYEKIRLEFSHQISKNMKDIKKLEEKLQDV